ncbi:MAG: ATP-binding protein [Gemmatimonadaceae bacterium]
MDSDIGPTTSNWRSSWEFWRRFSLLIEALVVGAAVALLVVQQLYLRGRLREQGKIQQELRASEAKFSGILAIAADAIITVDGTQRIVHFNRGAEEIFGYSAKDAIGRHLAVLLPSRFRDAHADHLERFAQSSSTSRRMGERREIFGLRADGTEFPAEASISKLIAPDGILFTVVLRDITAQRNAEANERFLSEASTDLGHTLAVDATLRAIVDLPVPRLGDACVLDVIESGNSLRRLVSSRQRNELTPSLAALAETPLTYDSPSPVIDAIRRNRRELVENIDEEYMEAFCDPETLPAWRELGARSSLILPLHASGETLGALSLISTDDRGFDAERRSVAEKFAATAAAALSNARLYDAARKAYQARDDMLSIVSHDLRNPLSAISMCARVLRDNPPADDEARAGLLATISQSTEWTHRLIEDLLDVTTIERGHLSLEVRPEDASQLALQAMHMFDVEASAAGIVLDVRLPTSLPLVDADGARVIQVLGNLLRNAIKFTSRGGHVVLGLEAREDALLFSVSDTGPGISDENLRNVFDRYWHSSHGARTRGTGLGLSIAKGIVEAHGGRIWVESIMNHGSTFYFTIPKAPAHGG